MPNPLTPTDIDNDMGLFAQFYESLVRKLDDGYEVLFAKEAGQYHAEVTRNNKGHIGVADTARSALIRAVGNYAKAALWPEVKK